MLTEVSLVQLLGRSAYAQRLPELGGGELTQAGATVDLVDLDIRPTGAPRTCEGHEELAHVVTRHVDDAHGVEYNATKRRSHGEWHHAAQYRPVGRSRRTLSHRGAKTAAAAGPT